MLYKHLLPAKIGHIYDDEIEKIRLYQKVDKNLTISQIPCIFVENQNTMNTQQYNISGMCCENCITHVKGALAALPEVEKIEVQLEAPQATVSFKNEVPENQIIEAINQAGHYSAKPAQKA